jgi:transcriptional regulator GlxA family with amidase domain
MLRRHFARLCGTTPQAYRRTFSQAGPELSPAQTAAS